MMHKLEILKRLRFKDQLVRISHVRKVSYTETTSKIGFRLRRLAIASEPACIAQLT
jgi:hypothetical protein